MDDLDSAYMPGYLAIGEERDQAPLQADSAGNPGSSIIFPAAHGALAIASIATRFGFTVAQRSVQFGLAIPQTIISNVLPRQLHPVSAAIQAGLSFAEYSALTALQLAEGLSSTGLNMAAYSVAQLDALIGSYQQLQPSLPSLDALKLFLVLLRQQWEKITPRSTDLPPGNTTEPFRFFHVLRALSTWALIQQLTQHVEERQLSSFLVPIRPPRSDRQEDPEHSQLESQEHDERPEIVKQKFARYIDLCLSSYGGLGQILFTSRKTPSSGPASLGPGGDQPSSDWSAKASSELAQDASTYTTWYLLLGKHDRDLLTRHGELFEESGVPQDLNEENRTIAEEVEILLPAEPRTTEPLAKEGKRNRDGQDENSERNEAAELTDLIEQIDSLGTANEHEDAKEWNLVMHPDNEELADSELEKTGEDLLPKLEHSPSALPESEEEAQPLPQDPPTTATCQPPRYYILIDRINETVIVCLRGTFSLEDLHTDLTCDHEDFDPEMFWDEPCWEEDDLIEAKNSTCGNNKKQLFRVHKGFLEVSKRLTGLPRSSSPMKAQQDTKFMTSIRNALNQRKTEDHGDGKSLGAFKKLEFVGHSLGGGVGVLLSLMLADPRTGLSTKRSGLPEGTSIRTYAICPPCTTSKGLSELSRKMVRTLINSNDFVPRLSMDHVLNLKTLIIWIEYFEANPGQIPAMSTRKGRDGIWKNLLEIYARLKTFQSQGGRNDHQQTDLSKQILLEDEVWLIEMRNLLESKIQNDHQVDVLLPAGMVYWMVKDELFIVPKNKTQDIFNRIKFDITMIKDHLIHCVKDRFADHL